MSRSTSRARVGPLLRIALALTFSACDAAEPPPAATSATPAEAPPPEPPPTPKTAASLVSEDGAALAADLYVAAPGAPAVLLVHRLFGDRTEFLPLIERLRRAEQ